MEATTHCIISENLNRAKVYQLVSVANRFDSNIIIELNTKRFNAKSLLSVGVLHGINGEICFHATGNDSTIALDELRKICLAN
ncbi:HPr family phosphocarrier protein [Halalkalibacter akibai]|uniref:HPr domain-containing protein n=1 Tax=Halalkalibacter akibai (strain ATCC 43226 / DSM 21942 / CIP 109018 / JCM 9157 / 1139) TaxID=1236973 RepID=W4QZ31_HALA3|nr:HPr family phosphocarrier protein [Halalkalibacter akibai]GAE37336.1 hypothetical protein JCM9157_4610 [Halalkalibacter akibai JCM 9157]